MTASAHASSMGGSQIWLKEGEQMSVDEMLKCIAVNSANDCAVAMAEHISGSEEAFTKRMNDRAKELGMENTQFLNCTGLTDDPGHYTTARDIACMSRALLAHPAHPRLHHHLDGHRARRPLRPRQHQQAHPRLPRARPA